MRLDECYIRDGPLENLWGGEVQKKIRARENLIWKKFLQVN